MKNLAIAQASTDLDATAFENLIIKGDLSTLSPAQRTIYYKAVCETLGLNPLTKPFEYIILNGKLTLYARKDCTEQLRKLHGISITIVARESTDGVYAVTARAMRADGRQDESIGAVPIDNVKGEARANAFMKAETKAKRRVTLSICGLGMLDETEVESITSDPKTEPNDHLWPRALKKDEVAAKKEAGQLKGQRVWHQPIPESVIEDVPVVDEESPAIFEAPDAPSDGENIREKLAAIEKAAKEKWAKGGPEKPEDTGTCSHPNCSAILVTGVSESKDNPGKPYWICHWANVEKQRMKKAGFTEKAIALAIKGHTRHWKKEKVAMEDVPF